MSLEITDLADHVEFVPILASWFYEEWGGRGPSTTLESFNEHLIGRLNRDQPPITFVGFLGDEPVGTAASKIQEMETHPQFGHWLGSVYVQEEFRGQSVASELIKAVWIKASQFKLDPLYLYTQQRRSLLQIRLEDYRNIDMSGERCFHHVATWLTYGNSGSQWGSPSKLRLFVNLVSTSPSNPLSFCRDNFRDYNGHDH